MNTDFNVEQMSPERIRDIQAKNLTDTLNQVMENSSFYRELYREAGIEPRCIRSLDDLESIPPVDRKMVAENFTRMTCASRNEWIDICPTSGTTGRAVYFPMTCGDLDFFATLCARGALGLGIDHTDTVQVTLTGDNLLQPTRVMVEMFQRHLGCLTLRCGPVGHRRQAEIMKHHSPTILFGIPQYFLSLGRSLGDMGLDPRRHLNLKQIIATGGTIRHDRWQPTALQREVEAIWGVPFYSILGSTELNTGLWECPARCGHHVPWDYYIARVVDPDTGRFLPPGETGELELTLTGREAMPLIRYRTGDITAVEVDPCPCGRNSPRVMAIEGRRDEMLKIKGQSVFPQQIEEAVMSVEGVSAHLIEVLKDNTGGDLLRVTVDSRNEKVHREVVRRVKDAVNLKVLVESDARENIEEKWFCEGRVKPRKFRDHREEM